MGFLYEDKSLTTLPKNFVKVCVIYAYRVSFLSEHSGMCQEELKV